MEPECALSHEAGEIRLLRWPTASERRSAFAEASAGRRPVDQRHGELHVQQRASEERADASATDWNVDERLHLRCRASRRHGCLSWRNIYLHLQRRRQSRQEPGLAEQRENHQRLRQRGAAERHLSAAIIAAIASRNKSDSRWERGKRLPPGGRCGALGTFAAWRWRTAFREAAPRRWLFPLPPGEGQGEGEGSPSARKIWICTELSLTPSLSRWERWERGNVCRLARARVEKQLDINQECCSF